MFKILHEAVRELGPDDRINVVPAGLHITLSRGCFKHRKSAERFLTWHQLDECPGLILLAIEEMKEGLNS